MVPVHLDPRVLPNCTPKSGPDEFPALIQPSSRLIVDTGKCKFTDRSSLRHSLFEANRLTLTTSASTGTVIYPPSRDEFAPTDGRRGLKGRLGDAGSHTGISLLFA